MAWFSVNSEDCAWGISRVTTDEWRDPPEHRNVSKRNGFQLISSMAGESASRGEALRIAILALPNSALFDIAGTYEAFTKAQQLGRRNTMLPAYQIDLLTSSGKTVTTLTGLKIAGGLPFSEYEGFPDTLIVTGEPDSLTSDPVQPQLTEWIRAGDPFIRRICSVCTAVFCLASAGLLNGHRATTHWRYADRLAHCFPKIEVNPEPVFLRDGKYYTSAGCTAAMDMALTLIEEDLGCMIATEIAREMVMFLRRPGGQSQISPVLKLQLTDRDLFRGLQTWIFENLHLPLTVEDLAQQVHMSPRNFARAFVSRIGVTPAKFIESIRLDAARRRLEETDRSLEEIASQCGFGCTETMRRSFVRNLHTPPSAYRTQVHSA
jgi:transcriptional regulator GlxA family with amidase domain